MTEIERIALAMSLMRNRSERLELVAGRAQIFVAMAYSHDRNNRDYMSAELAVSQALIGAGYPAKNIEEETTK